MKAYITSQLASASGRWQLLVVALSLFGLSACAGMEKLSVGRTDRLARAPYYKSYDSKLARVSGRLHHLPVSIHEQVSDEFGYRGRAQALQPLAQAMTAYLDSLGWSTVSVIPAAAKDAPYLYLGSSEGDGAPVDAELQRMEHEKYPPMVLHTRKPSNEWKAATAQQLSAGQVDFLLVITLGFSHYPKADRGFFGKKVVLGTGYEEGIRFLSAIDKPVEVLQVTGMLLDRDGNILRAGGEGIIFKDTPFSLQIFDIEKAIDNEAIHTLMTAERREDLPGNPLKWQVALHNLAAQLLAKPVWGAQPN